MSWSAPVGVLSAHPRFAAVWFASSVSMGGVWLQILAVNWAIVELRASPSVLGWNSLLLGGPALVLALWGGAAADGKHRRRILVATQSTYVAMGCVLAGLAYTGRLQLWHILTTSFVGGILSAYDTPSQQALAMALVPRERVGNAAALDQFSFNVMRFVGPAVGGLLIKKYGLSVAFVLNAATSLLYVGALLAFAGGPGGPAARGGRPDLLGGLRAVQQVPELRRAFGLVVLASVLLLPCLSVLMPAFVKQDLHGGADTLALFMSSSGAASAVAAVALLMVPSRHAVLQMVGACGAALGLVAMVVLAHPLRSAFAYAGASFFTTLLLASNHIDTQRFTPDDVRGRVMSLSRTMQRALVPVAALGLGMLADRWTTARVVFFAGALIVPLGLWRGRPLRRSSNEVVV